MNSFKESITQEPKDMFYKKYGKDNQGKKIYKGNTIREANSEYYLGGVSCFVINNKGEILIEKRANTNITAGAYDLCSGHINNNETPTQAMIREYVEELHQGTKEEQEIARGEAIQKLIKLDELALNFKDKNKERKFFIQFYALKTSLDNITIQKEEVESIEWVEMEKVFEMIKQGKTKFPYDKNYEKIFQKIREICNSKTNQSIQEK